VAPSEWARLHEVNSLSVLEAARIYANVGLLPIPLYGIGPDGECTCGEYHPVKQHLDGSLSCSAGKHPIAPGWQKGQFDLESLERQLQNNPLANVGLRMGRQPNGAFLIALDRDGPRSIISDLEDVHGPLPVTLTAKTSRGCHYVYQWNERYPVPKNNASKLAAHLDVRSEGGQIVVSPSAHFSGCRYRWIRAVEPAVFP
jgi:hypothetical protein